jgi:phosphatidylserine/phosphatidylglycerophosphate/cardiolipin synthase-like enzyme
MTPQQVDEILRRTLEDRRLSGGEKQALNTVLAGLTPDEDRLAFYRHRAFELAREAVAEPRSRQTLDWLEDVIKLLLPSGEQPDAAMADACFSPGHDCPARIAGLFNHARRSVDACVFTITDDRISNAILEAHRRGVAIRILSDNDKAFDTGSDIERFRAAGIPVRIDHTPYHMHHKFAIFDGSVLLNGSYNWTRSAAEYNKENFLLTGDRRLVNAFTQLFEKLWRELKPQGG